MPTIQLGDARISYQDIGHGEPVVLLHSSACSSTQWRGFAQDYGHRFRLLAPDLYGYGASTSWHGRGPLRLAHEAQIAETLIERCAEPVHLIGHSYGGAVALKLAAEQPAKLRSLTLIEPVAFHLLWHSDPAGGADFGEIRRLAESVSAAIARGDRVAAMQRFVDYWSGAGAWDRLGDKQREAVLQAAPKIPLDFWATIAEPKLLRDYTAITLPTLLLRGDQSPAPARRITDLLANSLPTATLKIVHGAGHMLPMTHGAVVNPILAQHLLAGTGSLPQAA
ncbi:MAG: alpha/beta fold hydrolase [Kiloniellales bacterium]